jgi:hypothetical protein
MNLVFIKFTRPYIQCHSRGTFNTLGGDSIGHCQKNNHTNMFLILNGYRDTAAWISDLSPVNNCLQGCVKSEVYKRKVDIRDELLARILDAAAGIKKREDQIRRTTRNLCTRATKCIEVDFGIFEHLL